MNNFSQRFLALDVLRGMTVCFMIIVNSPGNWDSTFPALIHAHWHGFTPADLVFPTFMFVVGNALSFSSKKWDGLSDRIVLWKICKRTFIIFLLGYLMYWFPFVRWSAQGELEASPFSHTRIMGVLQRIALAYFFAAIMIRYLKPNMVYKLSLFFLLLYWMLLLMFGDTSNPYNLITNAGTRLDLWLFGGDHLYFGEGVAFDPEGLLGTLPAIANVTFGYIVGRWIQQKGHTYQGLTGLLLAGALSIAVALLWNNSFPINKKLWTGSFVLLTVGIDCIIIAALLYVIDFLQIRRWTYFFEVFGKNPLFIYLLSELGVTLLWFFRTGETHLPIYTWLYHTIFKQAGAYWGSFLFALSVMMVCWLIGYVLDRKRIYVRV